MTQWILPFMILDFQVWYPLIIVWGTIYGLLKNLTKIDEFVRDFFVAVLIFGTAVFGIKTNHSVMALFAIEFVNLVAILVFSKNYEKIRDMAPYGHLTAISLINTLLVFAALLTSEL